MAISEEEQAEIKQKTAKPLMWVAMVSMIMAFAGLTSAYIVRHAEGHWLVFDMPSWFFISTAVIIASSITMFWATRSAKKDLQSGITAGVGITLGLGVVFVFCQFQAYNELVSHGIFMTGSNSNVSGSFLYIISGLHLAHITGGILALLVTFINALRGMYSSQKMLGLEICSMFWHFLDVLWIYLFMFLYLIR